MRDSSSTKCPERSSLTVSSAYSVLTIAATPLTLLFYPPAVRPGHQVVAVDSKLSTATSSLDKAGGPVLAVRRRFTVVLDSLESFGAVMLFTHLLGSRSTASEPGQKARGQVGSTMESSTAGTNATLTVSSATPLAATPNLSRAPSVRRPDIAVEPLSLVPLRLVELTERGSDVMLATAEAASHLAHDTLVALYRTFVSLASTAQVARGEFAMIEAERWPETVARCATETESDMVLVPWRIGGKANEKPEMGNVVEAFSGSCAFGRVPFELKFG